MGKRDYIFRYFTIIKKLRRCREATFEEIKQYIQDEAGLMLENPVMISFRTFQRDLKDIKDLFSLEIRYDFSRKVYYIEGDLEDEMAVRTLESIDILFALKLTTRIEKFMSFEKRKASGTQHFQGLLQATKNRSVINLVHHKFDCEAPSERLAEPLALKESRGRWYLFARDRNDGNLKTFGLDRIIEFTTTPKIFDYPKELEIDKAFEDCFGVLNLDECKAEEVILSFEPEQGKYIKSYPLHKSQAILLDNEDELQIRLSIKITHDFVMEVLSYGERVKVVRPEALAERICSIAAVMLQSYSVRAGTNEC